MKLLVPPGKGTPPPLGGQQNLEERSHNATRRLRDYTIPTISTLIHSCCMMLTNPYLVQVCHILSVFLFGQVYCTEIFTHIPL